jgi:chemotaxis protein MotB
MRNLSYAAILFVLIVSVSSCVSGKKYNEANEAKAEKERLYAEQLEENTRLHEQYVKMQDEKKNLETENKLLRDEKTKSKEAKNASDFKILLEENNKLINILKQNVTDALKDFDVIHYQIKDLNGKLYVSLSDDFLFKPLSDVQKERGATAVLRLAEVLPGNDIDIAIVGHTAGSRQSKPVDKVEWDLSLRRASCIAQVFISKGTPTYNIFITSGNDPHILDPLEKNASLQLENRTDIVITPKMDKLWELTKRYQR